MKYLEQHQGSAEYLVAVNGSQTAAPFILESGKAVIAMGGFGGTDPAPTLSEFEQLVATGKVHYVYVSSGRGAPVAAAPGSARQQPSPDTPAPPTATASVPTGESGRSGGFGGTRDRRPDDEHRQCRRHLGREARDRGLVERLRRQLGQAGPCTTSAARRRRNDGLLSTAAAR